MTINKVLTAALLIGSVALSDTALAKDRTMGRGTGPVIYVTSQMKFYDSIVLTDLPAEGQFQQLFPGEGPSGLATEFGPGDTAHRGGRWWIDINSDQVMDEDDHYFLCPLLGPGRDEI